MAAGAVTAVDAVVVASTVMVVAAGALVAAVVGDFCIDVVYRCAAGFCSDVVYRCAVGFCSDGICWWRDGCWCGGHSYSNGGN